jgi:hypothetical protein
VQALSVPESRSKRYSVPPLLVDKDVAEPGAGPSDTSGAPVAGYRQRVRRVAAAAGKSNAGEQQRAEERE